MGPHEADGSAVAPPPPPPPPPPQPAAASASAPAVTASSKNNPGFFTCCLLLRHPVGTSGGPTAATERPPARWQVSRESAPLSTLNVRLRLPPPPKWRNWETRRTQNPVGVTPRVGSSPTFGIDESWSPDRRRRLPRPERRHPGGCATLPGSRARSRRCAGRLARARRRGFR